MWRRLPSSSVVRLSPGLRNDLYGAHAIRQNLARAEISNQREELEDE
jgi:hypothetical protein